MTMIIHPVYYGIIAAVLLSQAFANNICNNTYTNGIGIQCFPCEPGYIAIGDCPGNITRAKCEECKDGTYQPECDTFNETVSCRNCTFCDVYKENCTIYKDAVCELKNDTHDSSDDSGDRVTHIVLWITGIVVTVFCPILVLSVIRYRKLGYYGNKNQESHRQKRYNQKTKRCSGDVVHKTNIKEFKDKPSKHNLDCIDLAPKSNKKEKHINVVRPHIEPKSNGDSYRCVNEYTPLDVELRQDEEIGLSSIMQETDDSSRCEIENTPLLAVRCEIKNTTPLDVELNKDERIGVSSLAEPDQITGYINICSKSREVNMQDSSKFSDESTDQNINYESDDDNETTPLNPKETERQIAVVYPYDEAKSIGRKEVGHIDDRLQQITKESLQVTGDYENTEARGSEFKIKENQLCHRSGDQSLSSMDLDKGTSELQINWIKVFLQLSRSFPASKWKLFAIDLLSNCQQMAKSVHDTVDEIELEAKNQHTESCFIHAYIKVFNKWLDNLGRTNATFEHIKDAVSATIEAKEALELVLSIERKPPLKGTTPMPLVPYNLNQTFGNNSTHSQQYMALHDDEVPGNSNYARDVYVTSRHETHRVQVAHCPYCSRYTTNEVSNLQETSVQLNKTKVETNCNNNDKNTVKRERNKKRKKDQSKSKPQQHKRSTTEQYMIDNAKENLL
ncbi:uncharacterized protein LOC132734941 [Ruditapes philippinarum]|uniref:uncharacterized protein LOC132734941 n=1 Tax=Ruditapes philippinarum TaxID=129788 RepID=UPI00295AD9BF|nr:uncharacterized protein LOC132734941 [Ruditapes philippinarum]